MSESIPSFTSVVTGGKAWVEWACTNELASFLAHLNSGCHIRTPPYGELLQANETRRRRGLSTGTSTPANIKNEFEKSGMSDRGNKLREVYAVKIYLGLREPARFWQELNYPIALWSGIVF